MFPSWPARTTLLGWMVSGAGTFGVESTMNLFKSRRGKM